MAAVNLSPASKVALYARVSTDRQAEQYGLDAQCRLLLEKAQAAGYEIVRDGPHDWFIDDGYSGGDTDRPALTRLRAKVREHGIDRILCLDPDRLARNLKDQLLLVDEWETAGVTLEFVTQTLDDSAEGKMFFAMRGAVAEFEKEKIRERTTRGRREKAQQGIPVNPKNLPCWLRWNPETRAVELVETWATIVREVYRAFGTEGLTIRAIARRLTEQGIPTPQGGSYWQPATIGHWLRDPTAQGQLQAFTTQAHEPIHPRKAAADRSRKKTSRQPTSPEDRMTIPVPAVIPPVEWAAVQTRLRQNQATASRNAQRPYLLRGLLRCGECGGSLHGWYAKRNQQRYYRCGRNARKQIRVDGSGLCTAKLVRADTLEATVWDRMVALLQDPDQLQAELTRRQESASPTRHALDQDRRTILQRLNAITREEDRLVDGFAQGVVPEPVMRRKMDALTTERQSLQVRQGDVERQRAALAVDTQRLQAATTFAAEVAQGLAALDAPGQAKLVQLLVVDITVTGTSAVVRTVIPASTEADRLCLVPGAEF